MNMLQPSFEINVIFHRATFLRVSVTFTSQLMTQTSIEIYFLKYVIAGANVLTPATCFTIFTISPRFSGHADTLCMATASLSRCTYRSWCSSMYLNHTTTCFKAQTHSVWRPPLSAAARTGPGARLCTWITQQHALRHRHTLYGDRLSQPLHVQVLVLIYVPESHNNML